MTEALMILLLLALQSALLLIFLLGAWALRKKAPCLSELRLAILAVPLLLLGWILFRPIGHPIWQRLPAWSTSHGLAWATAVLWLLAVPLRGLWRLGRAQAHTRLLLANARRLPLLEQAPWLGYRRACEWLRISPPPIYGHRNLEAPGIVGLWCERILVPAAWVPLECRGADPLWDGVPEGGVPEFDLQAAILHELGHVQHKDGLRRFLRVTSCLVLPWEWVALGSPEERKEGGLMARLQGFHRVEQALQETQAHTAFHLMGCTPSPEKISATRGTGLPATLILGSALVAIFALSPGRDGLANALGLEPRFPGVVPDGWNIHPGTLYRDPQGTKSVDIPLRIAFRPGREGRVDPRLEVEIPTSVPNYVKNHYPALVVDGVLPFPGAQRIEFVWEVEYRGPGVLWGWELDANLENPFNGPELRSVAMETGARLSGRVPLERIGPNRYLFRRILDWPTELPPPTQMHIGFLFTERGRYVLYPPQINAWGKDGHQLSQTGRERI